MSSFLPATASKCASLWSVLRVALRQCTSRCSRLLTARCRIRVVASHDKYAGDKNMVLVPGGHNSERPKFCLDSIAIFLRTSMLLNPAVRTSALLIAPAVHARAAECACIPHPTRCLLVRLHVSDGCGCCVAVSLLRLICSTRYHRDRRCSARGATAGGVASRQHASLTWRRR